MSAFDSQVRSLLRPEVLGLSAYHVQDAAGLIKLDAMENPYAWPEEMVEEWLNQLRGVAVNRYPDPSADRLRRALREAYAVPDGADLMLGNGSDELIQIILMAVAGSDAVILAPEPTFVMYRQIATSLGLSFVGVPLDAEDFGLDMDATRSAIAEHRPTVIFLAFPNNPTGNAFSRREMLEILQLAPGLVVVDEAYGAFCDESFMETLPKFPRLLIMRTLSKIGLAGLRLGLLVGLPCWIEQLDKLRLPYNINTLTQVSAVFALSRSAVFDDQVRRIRADRELMASSLANMPVKVFPSQTNFLTFRLLDKHADEVFGRLKRSGVLIKNLHPSGGLLTSCLRVTVGTPQENERFLEALESALAS